TDVSFTTGVIKRNHQSIVTLRIT
ncbi:GD23286, partial [Drosophila simulans]